MNNGIRSFAVAIVICCGLLLSALIWFEYLNDSQNYAKSAIVTEIDYENNLVSVTDYNGFVWQFFGCEDWAEGDICAMVMNNNGTSETIFDDVIVNTSYSGYVY